MEDVNKRITYKDIKIGTRTFKLNKFDALTGSYMLFKLIGLIAPLFKNDEFKNIKDANIDDIDISEALKTLTSLPKEDFEYIQQNCLRVVNEVHPNGMLSPSVLDENNNFGIADYDLPLILNLTVQSLIFNVSGFFNGPLSGLNLEGLNIFQ